MVPNETIPPGQPIPAAPSVEMLASQARLRQGLTVAALSLLILMLSYLILQELTEILRPLLIAAFLCYLLVPAHRWLVRRRVPSLAAHLLIVGGIVAISYAIGSMAFRSISEMSKDLPTYISRFDASTDRITLDMKARLARLLHEDEKESPEEGDSGPGAAMSRPAVAEGAATRPAGAAGSAEAGRPKFRLISTDRLIALGRTGVEAFVGLFTSTLVVVVYLVFLLAEAAGFERRVFQAFGPERAVRILAVTHKINTAVAQYILVKTVVSLVIGAVAAGVLYAFGVQYALLWGILTFFANFVPYIGSMVAVALPILMSFIQFGTLGRPIALLALLTVAHLAVGYFVEPRMIGRRLGVSPLMILLSLAFWGFLWGIPGMILSAPLIVTVKIVLENIEQTRPIARMMSTA